MEKKSMFRQTRYQMLTMLGGAVMALTALSSCDSDGLTKGDTSSLYAGAFQAYVHTDSLAVPGVTNNTGAVSVSADSLMWFREVTDNTCEIYYNPANPLHTTSNSSSAVKITDNWGQRYVPETVTSQSTGKTYTVVGVAAEALMGCYKCDTLILPATVTYIGEGAFELCSGMRYIGTYNTDAAGVSAFTPYLPSGITEIPTVAFARSKVTGTCLGSQVTKIGRMAYYMCSSMVGDSNGSLVIPANVTEIGDYAFYDCCNVKSTTKNQITDVVIPAAVTSVGDYAFGHKYAEGKVASIVTFHVKATTPPTLGKGDGTGKLFSDNTDNEADQRAAVTIYVPAASLDAYKTSSSWKRYADILVGE